MLLSRRPQGVALAVRLAPKSSRNAIDDVAEADQGIVLKARVTAVPEKGKANASLIKLLAKSIGVPKSSLSIIAGAAARNKTVLIEGDSTELMARLKTWLEGMT